MDDRTKPGIILLILIVLAGILLVCTAGSLLWDSFLVREVRQGDDLARIGYIPLDAKSTEPQNITIERVNWQEYFRNPGNYTIDLLIVGDSFSNSGNLPEYLASKNNIQVLAIRTQEVEPLKKYTPINLLIALDNGGVVDRIHPRGIMLETVPRYLYDTTREVDFSGKMTWAELKKALSLYAKKSGNTNTGRELTAAAGGSGIRSPVPVNRTEEPGTAAAGILKTAMVWQDPVERYLSSVGENLTNIRQIILSAIWLQFTGHSSPIEGQPYTTSRLLLDAPLFSSARDHNVLYFVTDDLIYLDHLSERGWLSKYSLYLNLLADRFAKKNITFYYLTAVDKLDFYSPRLTGNPYPADPVYDALGSGENAYHYINPKEILQPKLDKGEKDLYFLGGTHWSWMAVEYLAARLPLMDSEPARFPINESIARLPPDREIMRAYSEGLANAGRYGYADILNRKIIKADTGLPVSGIRLSAAIPDNRYGSFDRFLVTGDRVEIRGWAVDPLAQKPAEFVLVTDARQQVLTVCTVDLKRPDVAEQFSNQNLRHAGWAGQIEARSLAAGSFPLHAYVLIAGSETAVALPRNAMAAKAMAEFSRGLSEKTVRDPVPDTTEAGA